MRVEMKMSCEGVITAIITPYDENFKIDHEVFASLIFRQMEAGVDGILVGGSTGEGALITDDEFEALLKTAKAGIDGKAELLAGCSSHSTIQSIERAKRAKEYGVNALLVSAPYYVKPTMGGLFVHLEAIAVATGIPIIFYNNPGRTSLQLNSFQLQNILDQSYISGIKDSSGNLELLQDLSFRDEQVLYCGDDGLTLPFMSIGARGSISVISNLFPLEYREIILLALQDKMKESREQWKKFQRLMTPLFKDGNPSGIKSALSMFGLSSPLVRPPLIPPSKAVLDQLEQELKTVANQLSIPILS